MHILLKMSILFVYTSVYCTANFTCEEIYSICSYTLS
nr:MAG TPA: hypothetical protein [Caudoviricetes sp.]